RPPFFAKLLPRLSNRRTKTGRPHWLLIDEAHHLLPAARRDIAESLPNQIPATIFITVHPDAVALDALKTVDCVLTLGKDAAKVIATFCTSIGLPIPEVPMLPNGDEVLIWLRDGGAPPFPVKALRPGQKRKRHTRKYA